MNFGYLLYPADKFTREQARLKATELFMTSNDKRDLCFKVYRVQLVLLSTGAFYKVFYRWKKYD